MSLDGLSIRRTDEGQFVLVHIDKTQKLETEKYRSVDLDEVVDRLLDGHEKNKGNERLSDKMIWSAHSKLVGCAFQCCFTPPCKHCRLTV